jgi:HlyD family secretion protein
MKKTFIIVLVLLVLAGGGIYWYITYKEDEKPIALQTAYPNYGYISRSVTATGTLEPVDTVTIGCQVSGTIKNIYADFNATVKKGQLIADLDKSLLMAAANQYNANLLVAKSQLVYDKSLFDRQTLLYNAGAISKQDYETAEYNYNSAKANVASVQAQLDAANKNLEYASIYSPVDGVVMTRNVSIGQTVAASFSTPTLFVIAKDIAKMQVQGAVDEADIGNVRIGQRVSFTVDAYPDDKFSGTVQQIRLEPTVSANVVTYTTIINAPNENLKLKPGMTANITVYTKEDSNALLIPAKALKFQPTPAMARKYKIGERLQDSSAAYRRTTGPDTLHRKKTDSSTVKRTRGFVWVIKADSLVEKRVVISLNDDTHAEILYGLTTEDEVVISAELTTAASKVKTTERSPFMPATRPGSNPVKPATTGNSK